MESGSVAGKAEGLLVSTSKLMTSVGHTKRLQIFTSRLMKWTALCKSIGDSSWTHKKVANFHEQTCEINCIVPVYSWLLLATWLLNKYFSNSFFFIYFSSPLLFFIFSYFFSLKSLKPLRFPLRFLEIPFFFLISTVNLIDHCYIHIFPLALDLFCP